MSGRDDIIALQLQALADAITPSDAFPGRDVDGQVVASLTEAVMGVAVGLHAIAQAIRETKEDQP